MATRLKNISSSIGLKLFAGFMCIISVLTMAYGLIKLDYMDYAFQSREYADSRTLQNSLAAISNQTYDLAFFYRNEEHIQSGGTVPEEWIRSKRESLAWEQQNRISYLHSEYDELILEAADYGDATEADRLIDERDAAIQNLVADYEIRKEKAKEQIIKNHLLEYQSLISMFTVSSDYYFAVVFTDGTIDSNLEAGILPEHFFPALPAYRIMQFEDTPYSLTHNITAIYSGMSPERFAQNLAAYNQYRHKGLQGIYQTGTGILVFLLGTAFIIYSAGRKKSYAGIQLGRIDRLYLDVAFIAAFFMVSLCIVGVLRLSRRIWLDAVPSLSPALVSVVILITLSVIIFLVFITMASKRLKRKEFFSHCLFYLALGHFAKFIMQSVDQFRRLWATGPLAIRAGSLFAIYAAVCAITILLTIALTLGLRVPGFLLGILLFAGLNFGALLFVLKKASMLNEITKSAEAIKGGDLSCRVPDDIKDIEIARLACTINNIADGFNKAVESELKSERMRSELVTNVSHDLKTPLTSIITYIDLLKAEGGYSDNASNYIDVLEKKAQRLKTLTEDLFDAAKAASGNLTIHREKVDIISLLQQGLGELSDSVQSSGLDFRVQLPDEKLYVHADGKLLWRIIENLLSNIFKYSLHGSRVYIDVIDTKDNAGLMLKNISATALNMKPEELMERFKRGDESRHSEGSGLGLPIAKSLTELQGGKFNLYVDGDLFKAEIILPRWQEL